MAAVANNPKFAKKVGISKSVGEEFMKADKTKKFGSGGALKAVDSSDNPGLSKLPTEVRNKMGYMKKGGMMDKKDMAQDKKTAKKAIGMHEKQLHGGKKSDLAALKKGGNVKKMAMGGPAMPARPARPAESIAREAKHTLKYGQSLPMVKGTGPSAYAVANKLPPKPAAVNPKQAIDSVKNTVNSIKGAMTKMKSGGMTKCAKGGGIEKKGKTKGRII